MTALSDHFSVEEATASNTATRAGIDNTPPGDVLANMARAAIGMELVRLELARNPIHVSSWYRCPMLNTLVGSKPTSDHLTGFAIDFVCPTQGNPDTIVRKLLASNIRFGQIIREFDSWVHISFKGQQRQALIIDKKGTRAFT
jgi:hypothetical protein